MVELSTSYDILNHKTGLELDETKKKFMYATKLHLLSQMGEAKKRTFVQYYMDVLECVIHLPTHGTKPHSGIT